MEEARGRVLNHIFVLGGRAALCGCVGVRLVANGHLHGKAQALLVNSPGKDTEASARLFRGCKNKQKKNVRRRETTSHPMCVTASRFS